MTVVQHKHPKGLKVLFFAEMWERLSYYGMRALLILYMTKKFNFDDGKAFLIYGSYTALVYATPLLGGFIADRLLGYRKSVVLGGILMSLGHFTMAFENHQVFYLALALLITGNGFFKPNISTIVGALYPQGDARRDAGFTIFYMGVNVGALLQFIPGFLGEKVDWHYGFGFAGVGMIFGLIVFLVGQGRLEGKGEPPVPKLLKKSLLPGINIERAIYLGAAILVLASWQLVQSAFVGNILGWLGILMAIGLIIYAMTTCTWQERNKIFAALIMILFSMVFWSFFEQAGSSMNLFTDRNVDRYLFGWEIPTSTFQSVNPAFIIILAPLFSMLWIRMAERDREPSTPVKFGLGIIQLGFGFGALYYGAVTADQGMSSMVWLVIGYLLHTTGELCLSPIGLSMITKLSPKRIAALMMGTWYLGIALAQSVAAIIAALTGVSGEGGNGANGVLPPPTETVMVYGNVFGQIAIIAVIIGLAALVLAPLIRRLMQDVH